MREAGGGTDSGHVAGGRVERRRKNNENKKRGIKSPGEGGKVRKR